MVRRVRTLRCWVRTFKRVAIRCGTRAYRIVDGRHLCQTSEKCIHNEPALRSEAGGGGSTDAGPAGSSRDARPRYWFELGGGKSDGGQTPSLSPADEAYPSLPQQLGATEHPPKQDAKKRPWQQQQQQQQQEAQASPGSLDGPESKKTKVDSIPAAMPQARPLARVRLWTWGRKSLIGISPFCNLPEVKELARGAHGSFNLNTSVRALRVAINLPKEMPDPVVFNCRVFREDLDVISSHDDWGHSGMHPTNVRRLFGHDHGATMEVLSQRLFSLFRQRQKSWRSDTPPILDIGFECNKGRDRSVGAAVVFENALKICGWTVGTTHLCESNWRRNHGCLKEAKRSATPFDPHPSCPYCQPSKSRQLVEDNMDKERFKGLRLSKP